MLHYTHLSLGDIQECALGMHQSLLAASQAPQQVMKVGIAKRRLTACVQAVKEKYSHQNFRRISQHAVR